MDTLRRKTINVDHADTAVVAPFLDEDSAEHAALERLVGERLASDSSELRALVMLGVSRVREALLEDADNRAVLARHRPGRISRSPKLWMAVVAKGRTVVPLPSIPAHTVGLPLAAPETAESVDRSAGPEIEMRYATAPVMDRPPEPILRDDVRRHLVLTTRDASVLDRGGA